MKMMPELIELGVKVIDLSADFRLREVSQWEHWYGVKHACPELIASAVYALPETHREQIRDAQLLACPGCYPTGSVSFCPVERGALLRPILDSEFSLRGEWRWQASQNC